MQNIHEAINAFIENFNYIHKEGGQKGSRQRSIMFSGSFMNPALTAYLEDTAQSLIDSISIIPKSNDLSDDEKFESFYKIIQTNILAIHEARDKFAKTEPRQYGNVHYPLDKSGALFSKNSQKYEFDYHQPYKAGKYERNLIAGLEASCKKLEGPKLGKLKGLIDYVNKYNPEPQYLNSRLTNVS